MHTPRWENPPRGDPVRIKGKSHAFSHGGRAHLHLLTPALPPLSSFLPSLFKHRLAWLPSPACAAFPIASSQLATVTAVMITCDPCSCCRCAQPENFTQPGAVHMQECFIIMVPVPVRSGRIGKIHLRPHSRFSWRRLTFPRKVDHPKNPTDTHCSTRSSQF